MPLTTDQEILVEARLANEKKSVGVAFALWFFLGIISAHRFYLGRPVSAILQILSYFIFVGIIWWVVDAFLITDMAHKHSAKVRENLLNQMAGRGLGAD